MLDPFRTVWDDYLPFETDPDRVRSIRAPYGQRVQALYHQSSERWRATWDGITRSARMPETLERQALGLSSREPVTIVNHWEWSTSQTDSWSRYGSAMLKQVRWTDDPLEVEASEVLGSETEGIRRLCRFVVVGAIHDAIVKRGPDACVESVRRATQGSFSVAVDLVAGERQLEAMWATLADLEDEAAELKIADDSLTFWHGALRRLTEEWREGAQRHLVQVHQGFLDPFA